MGNKEWNTLQNATQKAYGGIALSMRILCKRGLVEVLIMASLWKRICPTRLVQGKIILYNQAVKMVVLAPKMWRPWRGKLGLEIEANWSPCNEGGDASNVIYQQWVENGWGAKNHIVKIFWPRIWFDVCKFSREGIKKAHQFPVQKIDALIGLFC